MLVMVSNCSPHADNNGWLAVTIGGAIGPMELILNFNRLLTGKLKGHPKLSLLKTKLIKLTGDKTDLWVEADGELLGCGPVEVDILPKTLRLLKNPKKINVEILNRWEFN